MKLKFYPLIALGICLASLLPAQTFQWAKTVGGTNDEKGYNVAFDAQGNVYAAGTFSGTADFDPGTGTSNLTSLGSTDIFLLKLDAIGQLVWVQQMGGTSNDYCYGLALDAAGNPHITGYFYQTADFDPGPGVTNFTSAASADAYVAKLDPNGNLLWAKQFAGIDTDKGWAVAVDGSGNVYTTGSFIYTCDFDPGAGTANLTANGTIQDAFISKLDSNGNYVWAKRLGGPWSDYGYGIAITSTSEVIIVGDFEGTADFDPSGTTYNLTTIGYNPDAFICRLSAAGNLVWAKGVGNSGFDYGRSLGLDASDNIYCGGSFGFTVDFDPGAGTSNLTAAGSYDAYLLKLDASGNFVWARQIGGTGTGENVRGLSVMSTGVYYTGEFTGTADFNPGGGTANVTALGTQDAYVAKLDLSGNYVSAFGIGSASSFATGFAIDAKSTGEVYTVGYFQGSPDFDPGAGNTTITSAGLGDVWVQKLAACNATASTVTVSACSTYTLGGTTFTSSGTYVETIPNTAGCDSVITLNLTILQPSTAALNQTTCDTSFTLNSQTYTSSGTYVQTLTNAAGCDSTLTLNLILNQPTNAALSDTACESYTLNAQTYTSSGIYTQVLTNAVGCDSTLTLTLTIHTTPAATINQSNGTLNAGPSGLTYQWVDCDNGMTPIPGATGSTYTPSASGNYAVIVSDGPCADTSACANFTVLGLGTDWMNAIQLYPNPTQEYCVVDLGRTLEDVTVEVMDALGKQVQIIHFHHQQVLPLRLNVAHGVYGLKVTTELGAAYLKVVRE